MKRSATALLAIFTITPFACVEEGEEDPQAQVEGLLDELIVELNRQQAISCDCWEEDGYDSRSECESSFYIGPSQSRCMKDAFAEDTESGRLYLECYLPLEREYTACIDARLDCYDHGSIDPCLDDYSVGSDGCVELPVAIERDLDACFDSSTTDTGSSTGSTDTSATGGSSSTDTGASTGASTGTSGTTSTTS